MLGALVQQQHEQIFRLQRVMDERRRQRRRDRAVWVRPAWIMRRPDHGLYDKPPYPHWMGRLASASSAESNLPILTGWGLSYNP